MLAGTIVVVAVERSEAALCKIAAAAGIERWETVSMVELETRPSLMLRLREAADQLA